MFPCLDTKGMDMAVGMVLGGEIAREHAFQQILSPAVCFQISSVLHTHLFFSLT